MTVANPLTDAPVERFSTSAVRLKAIDDVSRASWRLPGCDHRCRETRAIQVDMLRPISYVQHDPTAHQEYGRLLAEQLSPSWQRGVIRTGALVIDHDTLNVLIDGRAVWFTPRELQILLVLSARLGHTLTAAEILVAVWGPTYYPGTGGRNVGHSFSGPSDRHLLRVNMARIRKKLGAHNALLITQPGIGYRLRAVLPVGDAS